MDKEHYFLIGSDTLSKICLYNKKKREEPESKPAVWIGFHIFAIQPGQGTVALYYEVITEEVE